MAGHIRERAPGRWEVRTALPADSSTGRRRIHTETVRGTKRDAERRLRAVQVEIDKGAQPVRSKKTVADLLRESVESWRASRRISAHTAEQYGELAEAYIIPHLGNRELAGTASCCAPAIN
jgi:integrase